MAARSPPSEPLSGDTAEAVRAYVKLIRAGRAVLAAVAPGLAPAGLTLTQLGVLEAIWHLGPLTHRELGTKVLTSPGNCTDVVDKLAARGLVTRVRDGADRRQVRVGLTDRGRGLIEQVFPPHARDIAQAMGGLDRAELASLATLLRKLGLAAAGRTAHLGVNRSISNDQQEIVG